MRQVSDEGTDETNASGSCILYILFVIGLQAVRRVAEVQSRVALPAQCVVRETFHSIHS